MPGLADIDVNLSAPKQTSGGNEGKGATAVLVALVAFLVYLYLSGRLRGVWDLIFKGKAADPLTLDKVPAPDPNSVPFDAKKAPFDLSGPTIQIRVSPKPGTNGQGSIVRSIPGPTCWPLLFAAYEKAGWSTIEAQQMAADACREYGGTPDPVILR